MDLEDLLIESSIQIEGLSRSAAELGHPTLVGRTREEIFKRLLQANLLPRRYGVGAGRVVGIDGQMSREADIVFYDFLDCPRFGQSEDLAFYPSLGVYGITEIKSTLNRDELIDSLEKVAAFKRLYRNEPYHPFGGRHIMRQGADPKPFGIVFAFRSNTRLETLAEHVMEFDREHEADERTEVVVVHGQGYIVRTRDGRSPWVVFGWMAGISDQVITVNAGHKTLLDFYQIISELLVSVPTFPSNPAMYGRVVVQVDGASVGGQIREIDWQTKEKRTFNDRFLRRVIDWVQNQAGTTVGEIEQRAFRDDDEFMPLAAPNKQIWLYDPDNLFDSQEFPVKETPRVGRARSLASACLILTVNDRSVLVPRAYATPANLDIVKR